MVFHLVEGSHGRRLHRIDQARTSTPWSAGPAACVCGTRCMQNGIRRHFRTPAGPSDAPRIAERLAGPLGAPAPPLRAGWHPGRRLRPMARLASGQRRFSASLLAAWSGAGACPAPGPVSRDPGRGSQPCLDPASLPALQPPGREVLSRWARLSQPVPVRARWLDGRGEHRGGPESEAQVGPELPVSHRAGEAGSGNESSPKGGRSCGGQRQDNDGCPRGRMPLRLVPAEAPDSQWARRRYSRVMGSAPRIKSAGAHSVDPRKPTNHGHTHKWMRSQSPCCRLRRGGVDQCPS